MATQVVAGGNARESPPREVQVSDLLLVIFCQLFPAAWGSTKSLPRLAWIEIKTKDYHKNEEGCLANLV